MDNISHSLAALVLGRAGLNKWTPRASVLLVVSANMPDIDILALTRGSFRYLEAHRGITHSFLALPLLAMECVLLVALLFRRRLPWFKAWLVCCVGLLSHLFLDWTNSYGIRPFVPFSSQWFHLDWNALTDGPFVALLAGALLWPLLSGLVMGEIGGKQRSTGQGLAITVLCLCALYEGGRCYLHSRAVEQLQSRLYSGEAPRAAAALPQAINPFLWRGIVATRQTYIDLNVDTLGQLNPESGHTFYRVPLTDVTAHARRTPEFAFFVYFARFPIWSVQPVALRGGPGKRIELTDLRFGSPGEGSFHCIAVEDEQAQILRSWFTFGNGQDLGWTDPTPLR